jgi:plasmid stability protein
MNGSHAPERIEQPQERVTVALPGSLRAALVRAATRHERTISGEIRTALRRHLEDETKEEVR